MGPKMSMNNLNMTSSSDSIEQACVSTQCTNPKLGLSSGYVAQLMGIQLSTAHSMQCSGNSYYYYYLSCL